MKRKPVPPPLDLHRRESVRDGILRITTALAEAAKAQAARPAAERDAAVHLARLILKRTRALVRLLRPTVGTPAASLLDRRLRTAARRLAPARDAAVVLATLELLAPGPGAAPDLRAPFDTAIARFATRARRQRQASPAAVARALQLAAAAVWATARSLPRLRWEHHGWPAVEAGIRASYKRARRRFDELRTDSPAGDFHRWRTAVKALQYHVATVKPASPRRLGPLLRELDRLAGRLGEEHDLSVLDHALATLPTPPPTQAKSKGKGQAGDKDKGTAKTAAATAAAATAPGSVRGTALNRQQALRKETLRLGRRLFGRRPDRFVADLHRLWKGWRRE